jgi:hypothetical protein
MSIAANNSGPDMATLAQVVARQFIIPKGPLTAPAQPSQYPVAVGLPLGRTHLRPLQEPLYDTVLFDPRGDDRVRFFEFGANGKKTLFDTNLLQDGGLLPEPTEFNILGWNICALESPDNILDDTVHFVSVGDWTGGPFATWMLPRAHGIALEPRSTDFLARTVMQRLEERGQDATLGVVRRIVAQEVEKQRLDAEAAGRSPAGLPAPTLYAAHFPYHKFNIGRAALKVTSGERVGMELRFLQKRLPACLPFRIRAAIVGLWFKPLGPGLSKEAETLLSEAAMTEAEDA